MRGGDDNIFMELRSRYLKAKADRDYKTIQKLSSHSFSWLLEYCDAKISRARSQSISRTNAFKRCCRVFNEWAFNLQATGVLNKEERNLLKQLRRLDKDFLAAWEEIESDKETIPDFFAPLDRK